MLGTAFRDKPTLTMKLVDIYVKPIILYCSDFWGVYSITKNLSNPCDQLYLNICKQVLGVSKRTSNIGALLELARTPLLCDTTIRCLDNWLRVLNGKGNILLRASIHHAITHNLLWSESLKTTLQELDHTDVWSNPNMYRPKSNTSIQIKNLLRLKFRQNSSHKIF